MKMVYEQTAHDRIVCAFLSCRPYRAVGGSGSVWPGHSAALHSHFLIDRASGLLHFTHSLPALVFAAQSLYRACKNVASSRNVRRAIMPKSFWSIFTYLTCIKIDLFNNFSYWTTSASIFQPRKSIKNIHPYTLKNVLHKKSTGYRIKNRGLLCRLMNLVRW
jgi:hypothetical protein